MTPPPPTWSQDKLVQLKNLRIVLPGRKELINDDLLIRNGRLCNAEKIFFDEKRQPDIIIDCLGLVASPGLIDLQLNGAYGRDFTSEYDKLDDTLPYVSEKITRHGVTAYCPTIITAPSDVYKTVLNGFGKARERNNEGCRRARVLGVHLEGPFIRLV